MVEGQEVEVEVLVLVGDKGVLKCSISAQQATAPRHSLKLSRRAMSLGWGTCAVRGSVEAGAHRAWGNELELLLNQRALGGCDCSLFQIQRPHIAEAQRLVPKASMQICGLRAAQPSIGWAASVDAQLSIECAE